MARYDYKCPQCDHIQEVIRSMKADPEEERCAECNAVMHRVYQPFIWGQNPNHRFLAKWKEDANKHFYKKYGRKDYVGTNLHK